MRWDVQGGFTFSFPLGVPVLHTVHISFTPKLSMEGHNLSWKLS